MKNYHLLYQKLRMNDEKRIVRVRRVRCTSNRHSSLFPIHYSLREAQNQSFFARSDMISSPTFFGTSA